jgi:hypothetical protein
MVLQAGPSYAFDLMVSAIKQNASEVKCEGKRVKFTLEQAKKAQKGSRGIALLFL